MRDVAVTGVQTCALPILTAVLGAAVDANQPLVEVAGVAALDVGFNVSPAQAARVHAGDSVGVTAGEGAGGEAGGEGAGPPRRAPGGFSSRAGARRAPHRG